MKILLLTGIFPPDVGGQAVVYHQLGMHLGAELSILAPTREGVNRRSDMGHNFEISRVPFFQGRNWAGKCAPVRAGVEVLKRVVVSRASIGTGLIRQLLRAKPDIVCVGQLDLYWAGALVKRLSGAPVVFYIHGEEVGWSNAAEARRIAGHLGSFIYLRAVRALRRADAVVTVARFGAAQLARLGVQEQNIRVIYNGLDHSRFTPGERDPSIAKRHGLWGKRVLLTVSRLDAQKGNDRVIRAMPAVLKAVPNAVYVVIGDGPERGRLDALVKNLSLQAQVIFAGEVPDEELCAYYRSCDLFVQPNRTMPNGDTEGFGLVYLEAGACGKPVIGGDAGGVPEAVLDGKTGLLVNGDSDAEVAEAAIRILSDAQTAQMFGDNGRDWAAQFDWAATARKFRNLCAELARPSSGELPGFSRSPLSPPACGRD